MVKKLFTLFLLLSINIGFANVGLAQIASVEASARPQPTDQEIKNQCALIGNLTFLAIEKFKKGRELDQAKDELSRVAETAFAQVLRADGHELEAVLLVAQLPL